MFDNDDGHRSWHSIIYKRSELKAKYKAKASPETQFLFTENHFGNVTGCVFWFLIANVTKPTSHFSLIDGDNDQLLCELLAGFARLCIVNA